MRGLLITNLSHMRRSDCNLPLNRIDKFFKRAHRFGYVLREYKMSELIETRDKTLFKEIIDNPDHILSELLPGKRQKNLERNTYQILERKDSSVPL